MRYTIQEVEWSQEEDALYSIREVVFIQEQQVPASLERDEWDARSRHVLARDENQRPIACGRLLPDGQIGRMAVLREWRGQGLGRAILQQLLNIAREHDYPHVHVHSQTHALGFYEGFAFVPHGEEFMEAGIPHRHMTLTFSS